MRIPFYIFCMAIFTINLQADLSIVDLKQEYSANESIKILIRNNLQDSVYYYVSIESQIDDDWRELSYDITFSNSKSVRIHSLKQNESKEVIVDLKKMPSQLRNIRNKNYRLIVYYSISQTGNFKTIHSNLFTINK